MASQIVQAKCPGCKQVLRIPAAWVHQPIRCKHCGIIIQGKPAAAAVTTAAPAPAAVVQDRPKAVPVPVAAVAPTALVAEASAAAVGNTPPPLIDIRGTARGRYSRRRSRSGSRTLVLLAFSLFGFCLLGSAIAAVVAIPSVRGLFTSNQSPKSDKVTATEPGDSERPGRTARVPDSSPEKKPGPIEVSPQPSKNIYPRRALAISVNNYLYANPVNYGVMGRDVNSLLDRMCRILHIPANQIVELSDSTPKKPRAPLKPVIEETVVQFLSTCRAQDHILMLFVGHAVEIDGEAYLVPIEGDLEVKKSLIPLKWLYDQLAKCPARQKLLMIDVCRFDPGRGTERPGSGEMGEKLDTALKDPPKGVQVWSACVAKQRSFEFTNAVIHNGLFLDELYNALGDPQRKVNLGIQRPGDSFPLDKLVPVVGQRVQKEIATQQKTEQTPRLSGEELPDGAPYDPAEPPPPPVAVPPPPQPSEGAAGKAVVQSILEETDAIPPVKLTREGLLPLQYESLPPFSGKTLEAYKADYTSLNELRAKIDQYPLRKAVLNAADVLKKHAKSFREDFPAGGGGALTADEKKNILDQQQDPAKINAELDEALEELIEAGKDRAQEKSKRWQANYDYILARLTSRMAYVEEYNLMLGKIRKDELPALDATIHQGWRMASQATLHTKDGKEKAEQAATALNRLLKEHPGTPWEVLAKRERLTNLGLKWQPTRFGGP
jgi:hypothetical protein